MASRRKKPEDGDDSKPITGQSTRTLIAKAQERDQEALNELFRRYYPRVMNLVHRWFHISDRVENETADLVQNVVSSAFNRLKQFEHRGEGSFLAFLRKIVINKVLDERRKRMSRPREGELSLEMPDNGNSPMEVAMGREKLARLKEALEEVPEEDQVSIFLRFEYGYSYREIAEILGTHGENAVRMRITRAVRRLGESIDGL